MTATLLAPPDEIIHLSGISWNTYETLLEELRDRRLRLTYNRGNLEIMAPSPEHELSKEVWIYNGESLVMKQLQNGIYITSTTSQFFANIPIPPEIDRFLQQAETMDYLELVKVFRNWVRSQIEQ